MGRNKDVRYGKSVNDTLTDPFLVLSYEKTRNTKLLASSLFGLYDIYGRLKRFKKRVQRQGDGGL